MNIDTLWNACLVGDRKAQFQLYQMLSGKMFGVCLRYVQNEGEAEDILHAGFIKVFTIRQLLENKGSLEACIPRIMFNTAIQHHRRKKRDMTEPLLPDTSI